eukprot:459667-Amorphochlora_amoeboformis.AAC.1
MARSIATFTAFFLLSRPETTSAVQVLLVEERQRKKVINLSPVSSQGIARTKESADTRTTDWGVRHRYGH